MSASDPIRVMVVEDEAPARAAARKLIESDPEVEWAGETWGSAAVEAIHAAHPDVILLDIRMPRISGFDILDELTLEPRPVLIFVTAYDEHALRAFEAEAIDYLVKPFSDERFREALRRAKARVRGRQSGKLGAEILSLVTSERVGSSATTNRLILEDGGTTIVLPRDAITWIEASGPYVIIHAEGREHLVRRSLTSLEELLEPVGFIRVHRSAVVNVRHVREVRPLSHGDAEIVLHDRTRVKLSRSRRQHFEEMLHD